MLEEREVDFVIEYKDYLSEAHFKHIKEGLNDHAYEQKGIGQNNAPYSFSIVNEQNQFVAGIAGLNYCGCFYIDLLFVVKNARRKGYGSALLQKAEALARQRNCRFIAVNTMEFEAKEFYEKHGYQVEFVREGFEKNTKAYFLRKDL